MLALISADASGRRDGGNRERRRMRVAKRKWTAIPPVNLRSGRGPMPPSAKRPCWDPVEGLGVGFLGVGPEDQALARAAAGVGAQWSV
jgi:hypothetical protein